jgi:MinD-like ATPase involved in chromosome partitioning or flagellar assembly
MYVVTFYSFKGGVGRTMSLVNVGVALAAKGRRVLLVDFDLEAPGIPTFELFAAVTETPGVVDYVSEYISSREAPDIKQFITTTPVWSGNQGGVWLMPAGRQEPAYAGRLQAIDWQELYESRDGFLMFEDMKAQWRDAIPGGFDYVLIDSRTGHTDVGGICTRQLPDAVVIMFFPNEQNLQGLTRVVNDIRMKGATARHKAIKLHFSPSNVPDLDDEENILGRRLTKFREILRYNAEDVTILHHYNSLSLLDQQIFIIERAKSKLAREYRNLVDTIVSANLEDPEGATDALMKMQTTYLRSSREFDPAQVEEDLSTIARVHQHNSEMLYRIAMVRERMGRPDDALLMLDEAAKAGNPSAQIFARRAQLNIGQGNTDLAVADALRALKLPDLAGIDLVSSVRVLAGFDGRSLAQVDEYVAVQRQDARIRYRICQELMTSVDGLSVAERMLRRLESEPSENTSFLREVKTQLCLCLISQERYQEAMNIVADRRPLATDISDITEAFNYAMAEWGQTGVPPKDLFNRVVELGAGGERATANYLQCMAIAYFVVGNDVEARNYLRAARNEIRLNPRRVFSAWQYLETAANQFRADLDAIDSFINKNNVSPAFMGRAKNLFS